MTAKPLRVIHYCRVSSEEQATESKESIPDQLTRQRERSRRNGWQVIDEIIVDGFSGWYWTYEEFTRAAAAKNFLDPMRMWQHWSNKTFDVLSVRDLSRIGREQSILSEFIGRTIAIGAIVAPLDEATLDATNYRMGGAISGIGASQHIDNLIRYRALGMPTRAQRGLNMGPQPVWSHKTVYDDRGNEVSTQVDRSRQRLWDDLATVILEGVSWNLIEKELYERFGHTDDNGKPFKNRKFYDLIHTPMFWGNGVWNYRAKGKLNKTKAGFWVFDPDYPPPDGVTLYYGSYEPVYSGELAERIKGELRRRRTVVRGHQNPRNSKPYSGLLICDECGYTLSWFSKANGSYQGYRCISVYQNKNYPDRTCTQRKLIRLPDIQDAVSDLLREMFSGGIDALYQHAPETASTADHKAQIEKELADQRDYETNLRRQQARKPDSMAADYDADILDAHNKRLILEAQLRTLTAATLQTHDVYDLQDKELSAVRTIGLERFWALPQNEINQALHNIFGRFRLAVYEGAVVAVVPAPNYFRKQGDG